MSRSTKTPTKPSLEDTIKTAVEKTPGGTTEGIAQVAGVGRSTAGKALARLAAAGDVTRHQGGRDHGKRLPDRWTLVGVEMPSAYAQHVGAEPSAGKSASAAGTGEDRKTPAKTTETASDSGGTNAAGRLKPGELEPLVLAYLTEHAGSGPHAPTAVANALERSSGAVGNCLVRLTDAKKVNLVTEKPRRYSLAA